MRRRLAIFLFTLPAIPLPALAQNSEPFFSYIVNVIVEAEGGGGVAAPPRSRLFPSADIVRI